MTRKDKLAHPWINSIDKPLEIMQQAPANSQLTWYTLFENQDWVLQQFERGLVNRSDKDNFAKCINKQRLFHQLMKSLHCM